MNPAMLGASAIGRAGTHAVTAGIALATAACATTSVTTEGDEAPPSQRYESYVVEPGAVLMEDIVGTAVPDPLAQGRINNALAKELQGKGLQPAPPGKSDLVVTYSATVRDRQEVVADETGPGAWTLHGRDVWVQDFSEAVLDIDVVDAASGKVVWRSTASRKNEDFRDEQLVEDIVAESLDQFPPQQPVD